MPKTMCPVNPQRDRQNRLPRIIRIILMVLCLGLSGCLLLRAFFPQKRKPPLSFPPPLPGLCAAVPFNGEEPGKEQTTLSARPSQDSPTTGETDVPDDRSGCPAPPDTPKKEPDSHPAQTVIHHGARDGEKRIALTFDDGPHPTYTPQILDILNRYDIKATFFMIGENIHYYPDTARAVLRSGHEIGNHTYFHHRLKRLSEAEQRKEVADCEKALSSLSSYRMHLLRPPEGSVTPALKEISGENHYRLILWSIDTRDWAHTPSEVIVRQILDEVQSGDIILMHDFIGHDSPTPEALRRVIPELLRRGYRFVTVSELLDGS